MTGMSKIEKKMECKVKSTMISGYVLQNWKSKGSKPLNGLATIIAIKPNSLNASRSQREIFSESHIKSSAECSAEECGARRRRERAIQNGEGAPIGSEPVGDFAVIVDFKYGQVRIFSGLNRAFAGVQSQRPGSVDGRRGNCLGG